MKQYVRDMNSGNGLVFVDGGVRIEISLNSYVVVITTRDAYSAITRIELSYLQVLELFTKLMSIVLDEIEWKRRKPYTSLPQVLNIVRHTVRDTNSGNGLIFEDENKSLAIYFYRYTVLIYVTDGDGDFTRVRLKYLQVLELFAKLMPLVLDKVKKKKNNISNITQLKQLNKDD
jgi:hypothetical protein